MFNALPMDSQFKLLKIFIIIKKIYQGLMRRLKNITSPMIEKGIRKSRTAE